MRKLLFAALIVSVSVPAYAQVGGNPLNHKGKNAPTEDTGARADDKAYRDAAKRMGSDAPKADTDPWGNVRSSDGAGGKKPDVKKTDAKKPDQKQP